MHRLSLLTLTTLGACASTDADTTDDVLEIAVRRLNQDQDVGEFEAARDAFVAQLRAQPGVVTDREFAAFFDFGTFDAPAPQVFIGMTQYEDAEAFAAAGDALGTSAEAGAFFATFTPEVFTVVVPARSGTGVDLASMAAEDGQVIEVVWRDLSLYEDFDAAEYEATRDAALAVLAAVDGVEAEYQWVSDEGTLAVGMTVYSDQARFFEIATDESLLADPDLNAFFGGYPSIGGFVSTVVR